MNSRSATCKQAGLTLIEVMVALAVTMVLFAIAAPSLGGFLQSNKLTSTVNDFVGALNLTRSEAVRAGGATICASKDQKTCDGEWSDGWIVFSDYNADGNIDSLEPIIRASTSLPENFAVQTDKTVITFGSRGFLSTPGASESFIFCTGNKGDGAGRAVSVNTAGRPNTEIYNNCT